MSKIEVTATAHSPKCDCRHGSGGGGDAPGGGRPGRRTGPAAAPPPPRPPPPAPARRQSPPAAPPPASRPPPPAACLPPPATCLSGAGDAGAEARPVLLGGSIHAHRQQAAGQHGPLLHCALWAAHCHTHTACRQQPAEVWLATAVLCVAALGWVAGAVRGRLQRAVRRCRTAPGAEPAAAAQQGGGSSSSTCIASPAAQSAGRASTRGRPNASTCPPATAMLLRIRADSCTTSTPVPAPPPARFHALLYATAEEQPRTSVITSVGSHR